MARIAFPYPPSPADVPDDLTDPPADSTMAILAVLSGLFLFLTAYVGLILGSFAVLALTATRHLTGFVPVDLVLCVFAVVVALVLLLGIFNRDKVNPSAVSDDSMVEISPDASATKAPPPLPKRPA